MTKSSAILSFMLIMQ